MIRNETRNRYEYRGQLGVLRSLVLRFTELLSLHFPSSYRIFEIKQPALILWQRLKNMETAHDAIIQLHIDDTFKKSFLHLQIRHLEAVTSDLDVLFQSLQMMSGFHQGEHSELKHTQFVIKQHLADTTKVLKVEAGEQTLAIPLTKKQLAICRHIFNSTRESVTLDQFINRYWVSSSNDKQLAHQSIIEVKPR